MSSLTRSRGRSMFHAVSHVAWRGDSFQIREASKFRRFDTGMTMVLQQRASIDRQNAVILQAKILSYPCELLQYSPHKGKQICRLGGSSSDKPSSIFDWSAIVDLLSIGAERVSTGKPLRFAPFPISTTLDLVFVTCHHHHHGYAS